MLGLANLGDSDDEGKPAFGSNPAVSVTSDWNTSADDNGDGLEQERGDAGKDSVVAEGTATLKKKSMSCLHHRSPSRSGAQHNLCVTHWLCAACVSSHFKGSLGGGVRSSVFKLWNDFEYDISIPMIRVLSLFRSLSPRPVRL